MSVVAMQQFRAALQYAAVAVVLLGALPGASSASASPAEEAAERAATLIEEWRFEEAEGVVRELLAAHPDEPLPQLLDGNLKFHQGDYDGAAERFRVLDRMRNPPAGWRGLADVVDGTREATKGYVEARSPEGHFIIRYAPGHDEYLLPYAFEALEAARREIGERDFEAGARLGDPVRVEIFPAVTDLAKVSTLSVKDIETSGTIAICKFNKLMITSPAALVHGYPWLDTLAHEYTHFIVTRVSRNAAPIWLHEGLAKFEERRWRLSPEEVAAGGGLTPTMEHLLASALAGAPDHRGGRPRRLITFDEMYPSMAKLPSQEDTALAFAEVYTVVEYLHAKKGWAGVREVLARMQEGKGDARAVAEVLGQGFDEFQRSWRAWLRGKKLRAHPGLAPATLKFERGKRGDKDDATEADASEVAEERARKHLRLGGLLRAQNRLAPAVMEYEKALALVGPGNAAVAGRLARTCLALGDADRAIAVATPAFELYPEGGGLASVLGQAWLRKDDPAKAAPYLEAAIRTNPFDPSPHCALAKIRRGDPRAAREERACAGLGGPNAR